MLAAFCAIFLAGAFGDAVGVNICGNSREISERTIIASSDQHEGLEFWLGRIRRFGCVSVHLLSDGAIVETLRNQSKLAQMFGHVRMHRS